MSEDTKSFELKQEDKTTTIRFTGKRLQILEMIKGGKTNEEIAAAGFKSNTVSVVRWQAKKLGLLG